MLRACLAIVLMTCSVSPVLAQNGRDVAPAADTAGNAARGPGNNAAAAPSKPAAPANYGHTAIPAASQGGGGSEDDTVMRMRVPKWNSFLPGMFR